jgi:HAD superfamily hydrolase (TIGR01549 family)
MPRNFLRAVIFDLGGTLMYERAPAHAVNARADEALTRHLLEHGMELNLSTFPVEFRRRLDQYFKKRESDLLETTYTFVLRDVLADKGYRALSDDLIREALDRLFAITQTNWILEEEALATLQKLEDNGYRMGLISNAGDDRDVQQLTEKFGIRKYFDFVLTSAACGYRKPHRRIFELALANWYFLATEAVMVGDNLDADIAGAKDAGLYAIWLRRHADSAAQDQVRVQPDAVAPSLAEVPAILERLQI